MRRKTMSGLIQDLISDILLRLPVKALLRFRCLSKSLGTEIDSPAFTKAHLNQSLQAKTHRKVVYSGTRFMHPNTDIYAVDFDHWVGKAIKLSNPLKSNNGCTEICGSCNGLILLFNKEKGVSLWNPFTRRCKKLTVCPVKLPTASSIRHATVFGFGFDSAANDYKVVRIEQYHVDSSFTIQVWVFNLASNSWRNIQVPNGSGELGQYFRSLDDHGVFANGALHWLSSSFKDGCDNQIVSFDVSKEEFLKVFPPVRPHEELGFNLSLEVLGGDLILCSNSTVFYEAELLFGVGCVGKRFAWKNLHEDHHYLHEIRSLNYIDFVKPLEYSKDGNEILLHSDCGDLYWYDLKEKTIDGFFIFDSPRVSDELCFCSESLVSLGADSKFDGVLSESAKLII